MRKSLLFVFVLFPLILHFSCKNENRTAIKGDAGIAFLEKIIEYGKMEFNADGNREYVFINTGSAPLLLTHVKSTCGCTIPEWSKEPVNPGDTGRIQIVYDTHRIGIFNKAVYVYSNAIEGTQRLQLRGEVIRPEESDNQ